MLLWQPADESLLYVGLLMGNRDNENIFPLSVVDVTSRHLWNNENYFIIKGKNVAFRSFIDHLRNQKEQRLKGRIPVESKGRIQYRQRKRSLVGCTKRKGGQLEEKRKR